MMVLAGGVSARKLDLDAFIRQAGEYEEWDSGWDKLNRMRTELSLTHSYPVRRVKEIMAWVQSGEYDRIVAGEYPTRDQQADARKEAGAAVEFYKQRFAKLIRDTGASEKFAGAADKAGDTVADAAAQARGVDPQQAGVARRWPRTGTTITTTVGTRTRTRRRPTRTAGGSASRSALILVFMVVEVVAGLVADSLALLSDAAHMLTDAGAIALALVAARLAARPAARRLHVRARRAPRSSPHRSTAPRCSCWPG